MTLAALDRLRRDDRLAALLRIGLGLLFLYAGAIKAAAPHALADDIANYHLLPGMLVPLAAATMPWVELGAGLALVTGCLGRGGAILVAAMMAVFTVALAQALLRGIDLACGCFGGSDLADGWTVARDVGLLAAALHVVAFDTGRLALARRRAECPSREPPIPG